MEITSSNTSTASPLGAVKPVKIGGDFTTFLNMLTVQLKNQDPLNPMESSEFAVQLATFSSVEQQVRTNDLLGAMLEQSGVGLAAFSDLIGKELRVEGQAYLGTDAVELNVPGRADADAATLIVTGSDGLMVATKVVDPKAKELSWLPADSPGIASGSYDVSVRYSKNGTELETVKPTILSRLVEVVQDEGQTRLILANGLRLAPSEVSGVLSSG